MSDNENVYFVWEVVNGRPWPAKWYGSKVNAETRKEYAAQKYLLTDQERNLSFKELAEKYPYQPKEPKT